jgi:hypothetical protein
MSLALTPINLPASWSLCFPASTQRRYRPVNVLSQPPACPGGAKCGGPHPRVSARSCRLNALRLLDAATWIRYSKSRYARKAREAAGLG